MSSKQIIVVLTDGVFASSENVTLPESLLLASNVKILLYKLPQADDLDIYLSNNSLLNSICRVNGTFEVIQGDLTNPLYTVRSYFSYLAATLEVAVNGKPLWSNIYQDFDRIGHNIASVTSPGKKKTPPWYLPLWNSFMFSTTLTWPWLHIPCRVGTIVTLESRETRSELTIYVMVVPVWWPWKSKQLSDLMGSC